MKIIEQICVVFAICLAAECISAILPFPFPASVLSMVVALGVLAKAMGEGLFVEHALMSASHHLQLAALGSVADVFAF